MKQNRKQSLTNWQIKQIKMGEFKPQRNQLIVEFCHVPWKMAGLIVTDLTWRSLRRVHAE